MGMRRKHLVTETGTAESESAIAHFEGKLRFETDPADVHADLDAHGEDAKFVLIDTRSRADYEREHLPSAINIPVGRINERTIARIPAGKVAVTYCWSTSCNASTKGASRLAALGVPVKEMIGGIVAWKQEGYPTRGTDPTLRSAAAVGPA